MTRTHRRRRRKPAPRDPSDVFGAIPDRMAKDEGLRPITLGAPPAYLLNVPASVLFGHQTKSHRNYFESRGLCVPNLLDLEAARHARRSEQ